MIPRKVRSSIPVDSQNVDSVRSNFASSRRMLIESSLASGFGADVAIMALTLTSVRFLRRSKNKQDFCSQLLHDMCKCVQ